jgi:hypothetical protein
MAISQTAEDILEINLRHVFEEAAGLSGSKEEKKLHSQ